MAGVELLAAVVGIAIIVLILREVFKDLFHPAHSGALSDWIGRRLFNLLRRRRPMLPLAGPLALVFVIATWVLLLVVGFALLYYGWFPDGFRTSTGDIPPRSPRFLLVLYFSFETLITLGYGDLVPQFMLVRFISGFEALIGFGLLTASVSSIVLLYPALARLRLLARGIANFVGGERAVGVGVADSGSDVLLAGFARDLTNTRIDLVHFPIVYYFAADDVEASLARWVPQLVRIAQDGLSANAPPNVRLAASILDRSLTDFAAHVGERFVQTDPKDRDAVFRALARDHAVEIG
jgi:Ion channel